MREGAARLNGTRIDADKMRDRDKKAFRTQMNAERADKTTVES
jgi:hypothetical protein